VVKGVTANHRDPFPFLNQAAAAPRFSLGAESRVTGKALVT
jgi:hypothetical protein